MNINIVFYTQCKPKSREKKKLWNKRQIKEINALIIEIDNMALLF